jgi:hypothetical protein
MNRSQEEAGSVLSTAKSYLSLYRDPRCARTFPPRLRASAPTLIEGKNSELAKEEAAVENIETWTPSQNGLMMFVSSITGEQAGQPIPRYSGHEPDTKTWIRAERLKDVLRFPLGYYENIGRHPHGRIS